MRAYQWMRALWGEALVVVLGLFFTAALVATVAQGTSSSAAAQAAPKLFPYDGKGFIRALFVAVAR